MLKLPEPSPAWQQYIAEGIIDGTVPPVVAKSWQRCSANNVDPLRIDRNEHLSNRTLDRKIKINSQLIRIATPIMRELFSRIRDFSSGLVLLTDNEGYILHSIGNSDFAAQAKKICLMTGANWHEAVRGTNAIGTTLVIKQPVYIYSQEHFCRQNHILTCSASPIFSPQGDVIGTLDISTHYENSNMYTLGLVTTAAKAIETQLILENANQKLVIAYRQMSTLMETANDGLLAVDRDGIVTHINRAGSAMLGLSQKQCVGQPLNRLISNADKWLYELRQGKDIIEKSIVLPTQSGSSPASYRLKMLADCQDQFFAAYASLSKLPAKTVVSKSHGAHYTYADIIGCSNAIESCKKLVAKAARSSSTVLLQGETGTGKELFAQAIHNASARADEPFVAINVAALPPTLIETELFGYEEGAFTGARKGGQRGKFELANGGTIFLDEIGEMPLNLQIHLLRVLEEKQVVRIGGYKPVNLDIRVIAATNRNLYEQVQNGKFRLDLYYRLNVLAINIPPLRDRASDITLLADYFVEKIGRQLNRPGISLTQDAQNCLLRYRWPGNVRELENILERAINLADGSFIDCTHLPDELKAQDILNSKSHSSLKEKELQAILSTLDQTHGNLGKAARLLGIGRTTLYRKLKKYKAGQQTKQD